MKIVDTHLFAQSYDSYTLLNGMFSTQLPPLLNNLITESSSTALIKELRVNPKTTLFTIDDSNNLITRLNKGIRPPDYIYGENWAAESIKFFTIKINDSWRPMAIPNIKHSLMFAYNSLIIADSVLSKLYSSKERLNGKTSHSESPIIGRDGFFSSMLYEEDEEVILEKDIAVGFIGYDETNKFFKESKLQRFKIESTYPYVLQMDLSKFFENIYTHLLSKSMLCDSERFGSYLLWLDEFNQKINDAHTKGIIQGPISSKISAELFQLSLDQEIVELIKKLKLDINFTRYVDDYRFFFQKKF